MQTQANLLPTHSLINHILGGSGITYHEAIIIIIEQMMNCVIIFKYMRLVAMANFNEVVPVAKELEILLFFFGTP